MVKFRATNSELKSLLDWFSLSTDTSIVNEGSNPLLVREGLEMKNLGGGWYQISETSEYSDRVGTL